MTPTGTSEESTATSLSDEAPPEEKVCPMCQGAGFVRDDVPFGHPDFGRALPCRCTAQELDEQRQTRLQRYSNLGPLARLSFDNLLPNGRSSNSANQVRFQRACAAARTFAGNPEGWLVLAGPSGCGKTHLAAAIANQVISLGRPAFFIVVPDLLDHLRATYAPTSEVTYDDLFNLVKGAPLLILDDLGAQSSTTWAEEKLYQIINHRFNWHLPTVVTTSLSLDELDERLRTRLLEPTSSEVHVLEERSHSLYGQIGGLGLALLNEMTFETFDIGGMGANAMQRANLELALHRARRFAEDPQNWLTFLGKCGCGKTHLAAAIANYRLKQGHPVTFVVVPDLLDHLRAAFSPESKVGYDELFERVRNTPLLILDDLGTQVSSSWAREKLYQIINHRYNGRFPTVITSEHKLEDVDERLSSRIIDPRIGTVINIEAPDYRLGTKKEDGQRGLAPRPRRRGS